MGRNVGRNVGRNIGRKVGRKVGRNIGRKAGLRSHKVTAVFAFNGARRPRVAHGEVSVAGHPKTPSGAI